MALVVFSVSVACLVVVFAGHLGAAKPVGQRRNMLTADRQQLARASERTLPGSAPGTVVVAPAIPETFTPTPMATSKLTSDQAFHVFAELTGSTRSSPAAGVTVQLGQLTLPVGAGDPGAYLANQELVWAYSWASCPTSTIPGVSTPPSSPCVEWMFLDADTGKLVDQTWQQ